MSIAQGLGQALMEQVIYGRQSGQNLTGSFMDYCLPRADTMPDMEIFSNPVPTKRNPLGAKGAGEAGTVARCRLSSTRPSMRSRRSE
jgi:carbon-monoxide dehydrogenase large subunit